MRTIRNIPHDLLPIVRDITDQLKLLRTVKSASDHIKLLDATQNNAFLIEEYLISLDKEAQEN
jgi:hypothetical protein